MTDMPTLDTAVAAITAAGIAIARMDFPPLPFAGFYMVDGRQMTADQVVAYAATLPAQ